MTHLIFEETFSTGQIPAGWYTDRPFPQYSPGAWDCKTGDGVIVPLPHDEWRKLRVQVELEQIGHNSRAFCGTDNRTMLSVGLGGKSRHSASCGSLVLTQSKAPVPTENGKVSLTFEWTDESMLASSGHAVLLCAPNLWQSARAGIFQLGFTGCVVTRVAVFGKELEDVTTASIAPAENYPLEVTVDFNDDLMACAWTRETFQSLFAELKSWGTQKVSWIDLGREEDDYFRGAPLGIESHGQETIDSVGDIFTTAVEEAHEAGMELYGIFKPYDMAIHYRSAVPNSTEARENGRIHRIGGTYCWATRMAAENQHLLMARKPTAHGAAINPLWTRIDLVKEDDAPVDFSPENISLFVSDDNETYWPYSGRISWQEVVENYPLYRSTPSGPRPTGQTRRSRIFRFEGLEISENFLAIEVTGDRSSFSNRLCGLIHIYGEKGEETHFTWGVGRRCSDQGSDSLGPQGGFEFDRFPGTPTAGFTSGGDAVANPFTLDCGPGSYLAVARGKDRATLAAMSPSYEETRRLWMTWIEAMLDSGADGIDLRPGNHHGHFAWIEYGFEEPVRKEMLRRTGIDIWETDDFDYDLWRRVRGEGWTQFVREASELVRARGKKFVAHIDSNFDSPPNTGGSMNIVCDWRQWLREGLLDGVTGKALWPGSSFAREVLNLAQDNDIAATYAPYCNNFFEQRGVNHIGDSPEGCEVPVEKLIEWSQASGYDGFVFYECASALRAAPDGSVAFRHGAESLGDVMRRHFAYGEVVSLS